VGKLSHLLALSAALAIGAVPVTDRGHAAPQPNRAEPNRADLERLRSDIEEGTARAKALEEKANAAAQATNDLQAELVKLAASAQTRESEIAALTPEIISLEAQRTEQRQILAGRLNQLMQSLGALEQIERRPPAALLARPGDAIDRARSAALLSALVPQLAKDADELKQRLAEIDRLEGVLIARRTALEAARADLAIARRGIDSALTKRTAERRNLDAALASERQRLEKFAKDARDIEGLIAKIEADRKARLAKEDADDSPPPPKLTAEALAAVAGRLPARGKILRGFGQADAAGSKADGLTIQAGAGAQVTTPAKGRVAFSGPFKGYGQLLIVAAPGGYHILLAGLVRLYADLGQDVKMGEPIGELGDEGSRAQLYLEVRQHGKPVDPIPFLAARDGKVSG